MSQSIWMQCGAKKSHVVKSSFKATRIVETQTQKARHKLVDNIEEVERAKSIGNYKPWILSTDYEIESPGKI